MTEETVYLFFPVALVGIVGLAAFSFHQLQKWAKSKRSKEEPR